ncbi:MAG: hypothetical protein QM765_00110 [Myxococcales bacterium]
MKPQLLLTLLATCSVPGCTSSSVPSHLANAATDGAARPDSGRLNEAGADAAVRRIGDSESVAARSEQAQLESERLNEEVRRLGRRNPRFGARHGTFDARTAPSLIDSNFLFEAVDASGGDLETLTASFPAIAGRFRTVYVGDLDGDGAIEVLGNETGDRCSSNSSCIELHKRTRNGVVRFFRQVDGRGSMDLSVSERKGQKTIVADFPRYPFCEPGRPGRREVVDRMTLRFDGTDFKVLSSEKAVRVGPCGQLGGDAAAQPLDP